MQLVFRRSERPPEVHPTFPVLHRFAVFSLTRLCIDYNAPNSQIFAFVFVYHSFRVSSRRFVSRSTWS